MPEKYDLIVIGAGAAGLMGAIAAGENGAKVLLLEKGPRPGRKILISGGGRCNITNNLQPTLRDFLAQYPRGSKFLWSAFSRFSQVDTMAWFEARGLKLKTEADGRVFPVSDNSEDVLNTLLRASKQAGVKLECNSAVAELCFTEGQSVVEGFKLVNGEIIEAANVLIASGGMSYKHTGSSGDAYTWAERAGHTLVKPKPSLTGLLSPEPWVHELKGLSLPQVELKLFAGNNLLAKEKGALLFTHWGLSGPGIFKITSLAAGTDYTQAKHVLSLNLFPARKATELSEELTSIWQEHPKRRTSNCLSGFLPERLERSILIRSGLNLEKRVAEISRAEKTLLLECLANLKIPLSGIRPSGEEIVTAGGVCLNEVDPKTMQSKLVQGLYWAGEVLDLDGFTGGYNLQAAWSTGYVAGTSLFA